MESFLKDFWIVIKRYPFSCLAYACILFLWFIICKIHFTLGRLPKDHPNKLYIGEGGAFLFLFVAFLTGLFVVVTMIQLFVRKDNLFYEGLVKSIIASGFLIYIVLLF